MPIWKKWIISNLFNSLRYSWRLISILFRDWGILFMETTGRTISTTKCVPIPSHDTERPWHQGTTGGGNKTQPQGCRLETRSMRSSWSFQVEDLLRNQISFKDHLNYHFKGWIIWISSSMSDRWLSWILFCWNPEFPKLHRPPHLPRHQPHLWLKADQKQKPQTRWASGGLEVWFLEISTFDSVFYWSLVGLVERSRASNFRMKNSNLFVGHFCHSSQRKQLKNLENPPIFIPPEPRECRRFFVGVGLCHVAYIANSGAFFMTPNPIKRSLCVEDPLRFHLNPQQAERSVDQIFKLWRYSQTYQSPPKNIDPFFPNKKTKHFNGF